MSRLKEAEFAEKELELARSIQQRILPPTEISGDGYRISAGNLPARFVAGDFYDIFQLPDGAVGIVVADVAGKGVGASLIMATVKTALPFLAAGRSVAETLGRATGGCGSGSSRASSWPWRMRATTEDGRLRARQRRARIRTWSARTARRAISVPGPRLPLGVRGEVD